MKLKRNFKKVLTQMMKYERLLDDVVTAAGGLKASKESLKSYRLFAEDIKEIVLEYEEERKTPLIL